MTVELKCLSPNIKSPSTFNRIYNWISHFFHIQGYQRIDGRIIKLEENKTRNEGAMFKSHNDDDQDRRYHRSGQESLNKKKTKRETKVKQSTQTLN